MGRWQQFECGVVLDDSPYTEEMQIPQESMPGLPRVDVTSALLIMSREDGCFVGSAQHTRLRAVSSRPAGNCVFRVVVQVRSRSVSSFVFTLSLSVVVSRISRSRPLSLPPISSPLL